MKNSDRIKFFLAVFGSALYLAGPQFLRPVGIIIWLACSIILSQRIIKRYLNDFWSSAILSPLLVFFILGFILGGFMSLLYLNYLTITASLIICYLLLILADWLLKSESLPEEIISSEDKLLLLPKEYWLIAVGLFAVGGYFLIQSFTNNAVANPWQYLSPIYLVCCVGFFAYNLWLIFGQKYKPSRILFGIILLSFLVHGYLLVSATGFNADRFRHLGSEIRLLDHISETNPVIRSAYWDKTTIVAGLAIPKPLVNIRQSSYSFQWSMVAFIADLSGIDANYVDMMLGPILWALFIPLLLYFIGRKIFKENAVSSLLLAQLSFLPYILIYYGSQTLPITFAVIFVSFILLLTLAIKDKQDSKKIYLLFGLALMSWFSYILALVISLLILFVFILKKYHWPAIGLLAVLIFAIDGFSSYSQIDFNLIGRARIILQQFFDLNIWFFDGDWINKFSIDWLSHVWKILTLSVFGGLAVLAYYKKKILLENENFKYLFLIFCILAINFLLGIFFLDGTLALVRRLNVFIAIFLVIILAWIIIEYLKRSEKFPASPLGYGRTSNILPIIILTSLFSLSFISGPATVFSSSADDVKTAQAIVAKIGNNYSDYCILAESAVLLPIETYSRREIAGGNFPLNNDFSQPSLNNLLYQLHNNFQPEIGYWAKNDSRKLKCFIILDKSEYSELQIGSMNKLFGEPNVIGDDYFWLVE